MTQPRYSLPQATQDPEVIKLPRSYLPPVAHDPEIIKKLSIRILKLYIKKRKPYWESYIGRFVSWVKSWWSQDELDKPRIIKDCDELKLAIENIEDVTDVVDLINDLHKKAIAASKEKTLRKSPTLRADTYYAIIGLMQELMKIKFPVDYVKYVIELRTKLNAEIIKSQNQTKTSRTPTTSYAKIDEYLIQLVLLGDSEAYTDAFGKNCNLFPHLTNVDAAQVNLYAALIERQIKMDTRNIVNLEGHTRPNVNWKEQLQPSFVLIFLLKQFHQTLNVNALLASKDLDIVKGSSFSNKYATEPASFSMENEPTNIKEMSDILTAENETAFEPRDDNPHVSEADLVTVAQSTAPTGPPEMTQAAQTAPPNPLSIPAGTLAAMDTNGLFAPPPSVPVAMPVDTVAAANIPAPQVEAPSALFAPPPAEMPMALPVASPPVEVIGPPAMFVTPETGAAIGQPAAAAIPPAPQILQPPAAPSSTGLFAPVPVEAPPAPPAPVAEAVHKPKRKKKHVLKR